MIPFLLELFIQFFSSVIVFSSRIFVWFFFMVPISLLNFSFLPIDRFSSFILFCICVFLHLTELNEDNYLNSFLDNL